MFPIRDENPTFLTPYATYTIIGLNVLAWLLVQGAGTQPLLARSICSLGLIPGDLLHLVPVGSSVRLGPRSLCLLGSGASWYTPLTSMFLHGGWLHILGNMWFLWIFGNNVEDAMGWKRFAAFYLLCGLAAATMQVVTNPSSPVPMIGASGAIGGVMGAYIVLYPRVHVQMLLFLGFYITTIAVPAFLMLGYWFFVQLFSGLGSLGGAGGGVAFWAHVGGFVTGALLVLLFRDRRLLQRHPYYGWNRRPPNAGWRRFGR